MATQVTTVRSAGINMSALPLDHDELLYLTDVLTMMSDTLLTGAGEPAMLRAIDHFNALGAPRVAVLQERLARLHAGMKCACSQTSTGYQ